MPVIDIHTHIYPPKIAAKATTAVGTFYDYPMFGDEFAALQAAGALLEEQDRAARERAAAGTAGAGAAAAVAAVALAGDVAFAEETVAGSGADGETVGFPPTMEPSTFAAPDPGTPEQLLAATEGSAITHFCVLGVATKPSQVESINNFVIAQCAAHPNFLGFASMHQDYENPSAELERIKAAGLAGVKIHPDIQGVNLNDPRLMEVYEACERLDIPVTLHTGDYRHDFSHPRRLVEVLHTFPRLRVNGAHFGGWSIYDLAVEYLEHEHCWMDASSSFAFLGKRRVRELIELYGADRIMFGSDFPMANPVIEYERMMSLGFSAKEYEQLLWHTAEEFLGREVR